jgi:hypothetical protein
MKNIHIISTDKPSRLYLEDGTFKLTEYDYPNVDYAQNQQIYITSDVEIKDRDWVFDYYKKTIYKYERYKSIGHHIKIILTTDQDLIADDVQAIDDEFLEWFVKNPSCEKVEVDKIPDLQSYSEKTHKCELVYTIIIPQEEPKREIVEEAAVEYSKMYFSENKKAELGFIAGAKWQTGISYNEEDMNEYAEYIMNHVLKSQIGHPYLSPKEWFEQFKKK